MRKRISYILTFQLLFLMMISGITSCKTTKTPTVTATGYRAENTLAIQSDSLQGYVYFPNSRVKIKTTYTSDTITAEIRTNDTLSLRSMLINGVSFFFDPTGKQKTDLGVAFPAARSEMLRRQEEYERLNPDDTIPIVPVFNTSLWVEAIALRKPVLTDKKGTRFVGEEIASVTLESNNEIVYKVSFAFSQLDTVLTETSVISIGAVSELHQAVMASSQGGGGVATRPNIANSERRTPQRSSHPMMRMRLIPVNGWILFRLDGNTLPDNAAPSNNNDGDDIYNQPDKR